MILQCLQYTGVDAAALHSPTLLTNSSEQPPFICVYAHAPVSHLPTHFSFRQRCTCSRNFPENVLAPPFPNMVLNTWTSLFHVLLARDSDRYMWSGHVDFIVPCASCTWFRQIHVIRTRGLHCSTCFSHVIQTDTRDQDTWVVRGHVDVLEASRIFSFSST